MFIILKTARSATLVTHDFVASPTISVHGGKEKKSTDVLVEHTAPIYNAEK
jgi:hypothetical protein